MQRLFHIVAICSFAHVMSLKGMKIEERIMHGRPEVVPYQVYLDVRYPYNGIEHTTRCGASIISDRHLLSAAHCMTTNKCQKVSYILAYFGRYKVTSEQEERKILPENIHLHENFTRSHCNPKHYDVTVLVLKQKLKFSNVIQPINLPPPQMTDAMLANQKAFVSGYGMNENEDYPDTLQGAYIIIRSRAYCAKYNVSSDHFCADISNHIGDCTGDSGGALVINNTQYGIVSYGPGHKTGCLKDLFSGYTSVITYLDWIREKMRKY